MGDVVDFLSERIKRGLVESNDFSLMRLELFGLTTSEKRILTKEVKLGLKQAGLRYRISTKELPFVDKTVTILFPGKKIGFSFSVNKKTLASDGWILYPIPSNIRDSKSGVRHIIDNFGGNKCLSLDLVKNIL